MCTDIQIADVLIQGGSPGHAMIVVDMAINKDGQKIYLLAQNYVPAQDIHIVVNPENRQIHLNGPSPRSVQNLVNKIRLIINMLLNFDAFLVELQRNNPLQSP